MAVLYISAISRVLQRRSPWAGRVFQLMTKARRQFRALLNVWFCRQKAVGFGSEPILLTRRGRNAAAIISIEDLELLLKMKKRREVARNMELPRNQSEIGAATAERLRNEIFYG